MLVPVIQTVTTSERLLTSTPSLPADIFTGTTKAITPGSLPVSLTYAITLPSSCRELAEKLNEVRKTYVVMLVGRMSIEYYGRAASYAEEAPRLLITKPDGTLLIHEANKREPLNWLLPTRSWRPSRTLSLMTFAHPSGPSMVSAMHFLRTMMIRWTPQGRTIYTECDELPTEWVR